VNGTGRRISLTHADLRLDERPHGAILWPAATDKMGHESTVPVGPEVRAALDRILRERPGSLQSLKTAYQRADAETMLRVVVEPRALRG
jgi:hypothetical protein